MIELVEALGREDRRRFQDWKDVTSRKQRCWVRSDVSGYLEAIAEEQIAWDACLVAHQQWVDEIGLEEQIELDL